MCRRWIHLRYAETWLGNHLWGLIMPGGAERRGLTVDPTSLAESVVTATCLIDRIDCVSATQLEQPTEDSKSHEENTNAQPGHPIHFASKSGET